MNGTQAIGNAVAGTPDRAISGWQIRRGAILALLGLLFVAPFVVPIHRLPQPAFDVEWLAAVLLSALAIALGSMRGRPVEINWALPAWLVVLVLVVAVQQALGRLAYPTQLVFAVLYAFAIFGAYFAGRALSAAGLRREAISAAAVFLVAGALASTAVQWLQLLGVKGLPWWLYFELTDSWSRTRLFGNLGQANLLATYLIWAMLAVLYLHGRSLRWWLGVALLFVMSVGVTLTRSRLGFLFSLGVVGAIWLPWALQVPKVRDRWAMTLALVLGFVVGTAAVVELMAFQGLGVDTAIQRFGEPAGFAVRAVMWLDAIKVSLAAPLLGTGFAGYGLAQYEIAHADPHLLTTTYAHNLILETAATVGWPLAIGLTVLGAWWAVARFRERVLQAEEAFAWAALAAIGVHSMLEWPLASLHFAIPTAMLFALCEPALPARLRAKLAVDARLLALAGVAGLVLAVPMKLEYDEMSDISIRLEQERHTEKGVREETLMRLFRLAEASTLRPYSEQLLVLLQAPEKMEATPEEVRRHERLLMLGGDPRIITRLIMLNAKLGRFDQAMHHAERLRLFDRGDYLQYKKLLFKAIEDLGPEADPLRDYMNAYQPPPRPDKG